MVMVFILHIPRLCPAPCTKQQSSMSQNDLKITRCFLSFKDVLRSVGFKWSKSRLYKSHVSLHKKQSSHLFRYFSSLSTPLPNPTPVCLKNKQSNPLPSRPCLDHAFYLELKQGAQCTQIPTGAAFLVVERSFLRPVRACCHLYVCSLKASLGWVSSHCCCTDGHVCFCSLMETY